MEQWLQSGQRIFHIHEVFKNGIPKPLNDFEKATFDFCQDWLSGKESFTLHTSGSTGTPKPISVTRNQLKASAHLTIEALGLKRNHTALVCLDTRYVAGVMMLVRSLEAAMNIILIEPCSNPLEKVANEIKIDFAALVPLQVETILNSPQRSRLETINSILIGGAPLNNMTITELQSLSCQCYATYGMTETLSHVALQKINGSDSQKYFTTLTGIEVKKDERGCLVILAPHLSKEPIVTNDLVELLSATQFVWLGRVDNVINTGGVKVISEKVETVIQSVFTELRISNRFFVSGIPDDQLGQRVSLFIEGIRFSTDLERELLDMIKRRAPKFEIPRSIHYCEIFTQTATGKINKPETVRKILGV